MPGLLVVHQGAARAHSVQGNIEDVDSDIDEASFELWFKYWRDLFPPITVDQIKDFEVGDRAAGTAVPLQLASRVNACPPAVHLPRQ